MQMKRKGTPNNTGAWITSYRDALELATNQVEQGFLNRRLSEVGRGSWI